MRIPRTIGRARPTDDITPSAAVAPPPAASWLGRPADDYTPLKLEPEDPDLLRGYLSAGMPAGARPPCRIMDASRAEQERQRRTAAAALAFEAAVAENTLILYPDDAAAAAYLGLMRAALPVVSDRALPSAVSR